MKQVTIIICSLWSSVSLVQSVCQFSPVASSTYELSEKKSLLARLNATAFLLLMITLVNADMTSVVLQDKTVDYYPSPT